MADSGISNSENKSPIIPPELGEFHVGEQARREKEDTFEKGLGKIGTKDDLNFNEKSIVKETSDLYRNTTYWGYGLITAVIICVGTIPDHFWIDTTVQITLIIAILSKDLLSILKNMTGKALNSFGIG